MYTERAPSCYTSNRLMLINLACSRSRAWDGSTFSNNLNPQNIEKNVSDILIRIRSPLESSLDIRIRLQTHYSILPDIKPANRIVIIFAAYTYTQAGKPDSDHLCCIHFYASTARQGSNTCSYAHQKVRDEQSMDQESGLDRSWQWFSNIFRCAAFGRGVRSLKFFTPTPLLLQLNIIRLRTDKI